MKEYLLNKQYGLGLLVIFGLLVAPMSLLVGHIKLQSEVSTASGLFFTALTDSAGSKGFLITLVILLGITWKIVDSPKAFLAKCVQLGIILVLSFAAKTGLKQITESPRPYTQLLSYQLLIPQPAHFYKLSATQQANVIDEVSDKVSPWRTRHWQGETDYSFPSGHTIFASICIAFFGGIFIQSRRYTLAAVVVVWSLGVAYSRLWLGMHHPIDLLGSILFVGLLYLVTPTMKRFSESWLDKWPLFAH